jgi:hypothetical protein
MAYVIVSPSLPSIKEVSTAEVSISEVSSPEVSIATTGKFPRLPIPVTIN